jgi:hypothetical protein
MPRIITLPLEKTEGAIRNEQFRDTDNIRHTGRTMIDITLHRKNPTIQLYEIMNTSTFKV